MRYVKWTFILLLVTFIVAIFHYTLPQKDIVRITKTEVIRQDFSKWNRMFYAQSDSGNVEAVNRDLRLIFTVQPDGKVMVYRNEDTGFGWPPYLKLDSANVQAEAEDLVSKKDSPQWVAVTHYGWRNVYFTIFPNAVAVKPVAGPDVTFFPWLNIVILTVCGLFILGFYRLIQRFKRRKIDPLIEKAEETWDDVEAKAGDVGDSASAAGGKARGFFKRWFG